MISQHPSPMSGKGWETVDHFKVANEVLVEQGKEPIDWNIPK